MPWKGSALTFLLKLSRTHALLEQTHLVMLSMGFAPDVINVFSRAATMHSLNWCSLVLIPCRPRLQKNVARLIPIVQAWFWAKVQLCSPSKNWNPHGLAAQTL